MVSGKREISNNEAEPKIRKKTRTKKLICWLFIDLLVAVVIFALLLHRPGRYDPADRDAVGLEDGQVSPYLTHELSPQFYNGAQRGEPFELVITQKGINEIVAGWGWPRMSEGIMLYAPAVVFSPGSVVLMGTANVKGVEFVVTIVLKPSIDERGLSNLPVAEVKVGAMNITPLAKMMAKKMYTQRLATMSVDTRSFYAKIAAALLNGEPFEPVFEVDRRKLRIEGIIVENEKLTAHLVPAS
ncbi:MAG: hypothetical protein JSW66_20110 [Phycisphaerales bacterium]|nr:MAG: hypothetical protein JSW66_20110 [Phycisphaerales bacterium]